MSYNYSHCKLFGNVNELCNFWAKLHHKVYITSYYLTNETALIEKHNRALKKKIAFEAFVEKYFRDVLGNKITFARNPDGSWRNGSRAVVCTAW